MLLLLLNQRACFLFMINAGIVDTVRLLWEWNSVPLFIVLTNPVPYVWGVYKCPKCIYTSYMWTYYSSIRTIWEIVFRFFSSWIVYGHATVRPFLLFCNQADLVWFQNRVRFFGATMFPARVRKDRKSVSMYWCITIFCNQLGAGRLVL